MSKHIERVALEDIQWLRIYHNTRRVTLAQAMAETGADLGWNGGLYDLSTWELCGHVKADGQVLHAEPWGCWGYAWDEGPDIKLVVLPDYPCIQWPMALPEWFPPVRFASCWGPDYLERRLAED